MSTEGLVLYYEDVDVQFGTSIAPCPGSEKYHLPGIHGLDNCSRHFPKKCVSNLRHFLQVYTLSPISSSLFTHEEAIALPGTAPIILREVF